MYKTSEKKQSESGQVIILLTAGLITLLAFTALAIDGGMYLSDRRTAQGNSDAIALSAAYAACMGEDPLQAAMYAASLTEIEGNGLNTVTVNMPPVHGNYIGEDDYIEVVITTVTEGTFSKLITTEPLRSTVRTVSHCDNTGTNQQILGSAMVSLNETERDALFINGNGNVVVESGGIFVNSINDQAMRVTGNGGVDSDTIAIVGNYSIHKPDQVTPTPTTGVGSLKTPFAGLTPPPKPSGPCTTVNLASSSNVTLNPGLYCSINISGNANLTMNPGIYWIETGGMSYTGNGNVYANEVMIYMGPNAGDVKITGNGDFYISPPTSGEYAGMSFYQDPDNTSTFKITGNGDSTSLGGTFFAPSAQIQISGNGDFNLTAQLIGDTIKASGNGDITITHNPAGNYQHISPITISLTE